jgi:hypothetical protein
MEYNAQTSIVRTNDFWQFLFYFSRIISQELIITSLFIIRVILNPFSATFLPCIVRREYFSTIFNIKKCALYNKIRYITKKLQKFILKNFRECTPSSDTNVGRTRTTTNVFLGSNAGRIRHLD